MYRPQLLAPEALTPLVRFSPAILSNVSLVPLARSGESLPLADTRAGNVFADRFDVTLAWYLPVFQLPGGIDAAFAFAATQTGAADDAGNPFDRATLTLTLEKTMPADALAYQQQHPTQQLREIPLQALTAILTTTSNDPKTGAPTSSTYSGTLHAVASGVQVSFNTLLGAGLIVAYENLQNGGASIGLCATYAVWQKPPPAFQIRPVRMMPLTALRQQLPPVPKPPDPPYQQTTASFGLVLPLAKTYAETAYASKYTIGDGAATHAIVNVNDLKDFNTRQSEFSEFTALGDISQKYPSFGRLYIGALSRQIVVVPARYGIVRSSQGTAAICDALLDSTAGSTTSCKFEFTFVLGPVFSPIEFLELAKDLAADTASADCTVGFPWDIDSASGGSLLQTPFQTAVSYTAGAQPHTFSLSAVIADVAGGSPAVANANLFIKQLIAGVEPYLVGQIAVKLDDFYGPVSADVVLNFSVTSGSDEIGFTIDSNTQAIELVNNSPLDLSLSRYAVGTGGSLAITALPIALPAHQRVALNASSGGSDAGVLVDRTLELESPLTKADAGRYLAFQLQDVESVQYQLGVVAPGVHFNTLGIEKIDVTVSLNDLPQVAVPGFTLTAQNTSGNVQIELPIQYAITTLSATVAFTVWPSSPSHAAAQFTLSNDFIDNPVLVLQESIIPQFTSPAPSVG